MAEFLMSKGEAKHNTEATAVLSRIQELMQNKVDLGDICVLSRTIKS